MSRPSHSRNYSVGLKYGLPIFLEDRSGSLSGSDFIDIHERMRLIYRSRHLDSSREHQHPYVYDIIDATANTVEDFNIPVVTLAFGPNHELGTVKYKGSAMVSMDSYLSQVNEIAGSKLRRFFASDGNEYRWGFRVTSDSEWTATNSAGEIVAYYSLKSPGEPVYPNSSGCMLSVEESWGHLACEMLATVMIMRHIAKYDL